LDAADERFTEYTINAEKATESLKMKNSEHLQKIHETQLLLDHEKEEKLTALLKNAEISQAQELIKTELRLEKEESQELHEKCTHLEDDIKMKEQEIRKQQQQLEELKTQLHNNDNKLKEFDVLQNDLCEKNKVNFLLWF